MSLANYLNSTVDTDPAYGSCFEQVIAAAGIAVRRDPLTKAPSTRMSKLLGTGAGSEMAIVRPDGSQALTVSGRMLFPAVVEQMMYHALMEDTSTYEGVYNQMIAMTSSVDSPRVYTPVANVLAPRGSLAQPIGQMAEPAAMLSISLSDRSLTIPRASIGLEIDDDAAKVVALDVVGMQLQQQAIGQRISLIDTGINSMIAGDLDLGLSALSSELMTAYDSTSTTAGAITHKAWIKWLRKDWKKMTIDWVFCDIDTFLAIENRTGRPIITSNQGTDGRLNVTPVIAIPGLGDNVKFFIVETALIGANTLVGIDSSKAIHKYLWAAGQYAATESYVMRRSTAMRFDFAEMTTRFYPNGDGWKKLTLTTS